MSISSCHTTYTWSSRPLLAACPTVSRPVAMASRGAAIWARSMPPHNATIRCTQHRRVKCAVTEATSSDPSQSQSTRFMVSNSGSEAERPVPRRNAKSHILCENLGCFRRPSFAHEGSRARFCATHKQPAMVDVAHKRCEEPGCSVKPSFTMPGETCPRFCAEHSLPGMMDVVSQRCIHPGCGTRASFAEAAGKPATFCLAHKAPKMVQTMNKICAQPGCKIGANFGEVGGKPRFCTSHKYTGMVDLRSRRCQHPGCGVRPSFSKPGSGSASFCLAHKEVGMVRTYAR